MICDLIREKSVDLYIWHSVYGYCARRAVVVFFSGERKWCVVFLIAGPLAEFGRFDIVSRELMESESYDPEQFNIW